MATEQAPLINGFAYSWSDVKTVILGRLLTGITAIKYDDEQEMEDNYGAGNFPVSRGVGRIKSSASVTLHKEEVEALTSIAPQGRLQNIPPFDIVVKFMGANNLIRTHLLKNAQFTKNSRDMKEGDMKFEIELPLIISHIVWNA